MQFQREASRQFDVVSYFERWPNDSRFQLTNQQPLHSSTTSSLVSQWSVLTRLTSARFFGAWTVAEFNKNVR